jgi:hypothetical protein
VLRLGITHLIAWVDATKECGILLAKVLTRLGQDC